MSVAVGARQGGQWIAVRPPRAAMAAGVGLAVLSGLLLLVPDVGLGLAFVPVALLLAAIAVSVMPLRYVMLGLLTIGMAAEIPQDRPFTGQWRSPLYYAGAFVFDNLNNVVGVSALRFSGLDAMVVLLSLVVAARVFYGYTSDAAGRQPVPRPVMLVLAGAFATIVFLEVFGIGRGGNFKNSLWQVRPLLWTPVLAALFAYALRGPADFPAIARIVVGSACFKVLLGSYYLYVYVPSHGLEHPAYVTTHGDSTLFVTAIAICVACWLQRPTLRHLLLNLTVSPWILFGIQINNRRLAFVSLFGALFVQYVLLRGPIKRRITILAIAAAPLAVAYIAVGFKKNHGIWGPAAKIASVVTQKDNSSATRDIENYNLIQTLKQNKVLGSGFGHEYIELSKGDDISHAFALYRYIGHNSVLWLWSLAGLVFFTAFWLIVPTGVFVATRAYHYGRDWRERAAASSALAVMAAYVMQAWGDMGSQSYIAILLLATAVASAGKLAVANGGWMLNGGAAPHGRVS